MDWYGTTHLDELGEAMDWGGVLKGVALLAHQQNILRVVLRTIESPDPRIAREAPHKNTADYQALEKSLKKIRNVPLLDVNHHP